MDGRQELVELATSLTAGAATRHGLQHWLDTNDNSALEQTLRDLGIKDDIAVLIVAGLAGPASKWVVRAIIKIHNDPEARNRAKRIGKRVLSALAALGDPELQNPVGSLYRTPKD